MESIVLTPDITNVGERLDKYVSENVENLSRSYAASLTKEGLILCGEKKT